MCSPPATYLLQPIILARMSSAASVGHSVQQDCTCCSRRAVRAGPGPPDGIISHCESFRCMLQCGHGSSPCCMPVWYKGWVLVLQLVCCSPVAGLGVVERTGLLLPTAVRTACLSHRHSVVVDRLRQQYHCCSCCHYCKVRTGGSIETGASMAPGHPTWADSLTLHCDGPYPPYSRLTSWQHCP